MNTKMTKADTIFKKYIRKIMVLRLSEQARPKYKDDHNASASPARLI